MQAGSDGFSVEVEQMDVKNCVVTDEGKSFSLHHLGDVILMDSHN